MTTKISMWTEPSIVDPDNPPEYPYDKIWQSECQHSIELDDTPDRERVRIQHRDGSFQEFQTTDNSPAIWRATYFTPINRVGRILCGSVITQG